MSRARIKYLLVNDKKLFAAKVQQRLERYFRYKNLLWDAKRRLRGSNQSAEPSSSLDLLSTSISVPVVILEKRASYIRCAVLDEHVPTLIADLCTAFSNLGRLSRGSFRPFDPMQFMPRAVNASGFTLGFVSGVPTTRWRFEIFERTDTSFVSRTGTNTLTGVLYGDVFDRIGVTDLATSLPEIKRQVNEQTFDVVYTWVNSADPGWQSLFRTIDPDKASEDARDSSRFNSNDELKYSLRSVHQHLPWVRNIYVVSNCRPPAWLDPEHPKLRWIPHEAIMSSDSLPTFNSHAIEASLHRIEGLAENFLYFNDDMFAFDALTPALFVNENGTLAANLERQGVVNSMPDPASPDYLNASRNSARLLYERYGYYPTRLHRHTPYSLSKSLLYQLEDEFPDAFDKTRRSRFRSMTDVNVTSFFAHHFGYVKRAVVYGGYSSSLIKSNDPFSLLRLRRLARARRRPRAICINEGGKPAPTQAWRDATAAFLATQFPRVAPWEVVDEHQQHDR